MIYRFAATQVAGSWAQVSAGWDHTCGVTTTGAGYCWGRDNNGRGGSGVFQPPTNENIMAPLLIAGGHIWSRMGLSAFNSCGIRTDQSLWCWGSPNNGALGDGVTYASTYTRQTTPVQTVPHAATWSTVSGGDYYHCGLRTDATLWCWGLNDKGQIGSGSAIAANPTPLQIAGSWRDMSTGYDHACAIKTDRTLWCWGENTSGELGRGATSTSGASPGQVGTDTDWDTVTAGRAFTCARKTDSTVWCWGINTEGQLGITASLTVRTSPAQVAGVTASAIFAQNFTQTIYAFL